MTTRSTIISFDAFENKAVYEARADASEYDLPTIIRMELDKRFGCVPVREPKKKRVPKSASILRDVRLLCSKILLDESLCIGEEPTKSSLLSSKSISREIVVFIDAIDPCSLLCATDEIQRALKRTKYAVDIVREYLNTLMRLLSERQTATYITRDTLDEVLLQFTRALHRLKSQLLLLTHEIGGSHV